MAATVAGSCTTLTLLGPFNTTVKSTRVPIHALTAATNTAATSAAQNDTNATTIIIIIISGAATETCSWPGHSAALEQLWLMWFVGGMIFSTLGSELTDDQYYCILFARECLSWSRHHRRRHPCGDGVSVVMRTHLLIGASSSSCRNGCHSSNSCSSRNGGGRRSNGMPLGHWVTV